MTVPEKATSVEVAFELIGSGSSSSSTFGTPRLGIVNWNQVLLYPASKDAMKLPFRASLTLPAGWKLGTALRVADAKGDTTTFAPASLEELIESKVGDFVKGMRNGSAKNLYPILMSAVERPLLTRALKETNGNQIQAARLLGMNRNTLRKKITALHIPVSRTKSVQTIAG